MIDRSVLRCPVCGRMPSQHKEGGLQMHLRDSSVGKAMVWLSKVGEQMARWLEEQATTEKNSEN